MGDRYFLKMTCDRCGAMEEDVYFAPTCGFTTWKCKCGNKIDLIEHTGITAEMASNKTEIEDAIREALRGGEKVIERRKP